MSAPTPIDPAFLQRKFPEIARLARQGEPWDQIGVAMLRGVQRSGSRQRGATIGAGSGTGFRSSLAAGPESEWAAAKSALHQLFCSDSEDLREIRQRLGDSAASATPLLLATLSLWLAGHSGKSVTRTTPLVATVLLGMALDEENIWRDSPAGLNA